MYVYFSTRTYILLCLSSNRSHLHSFSLSLSLSLSHLHFFFSRPPYVSLPVFLYVMVCRNFANFGYRSRVRDTHSKRARAPSAVTSNVSQLSTCDASTRCNSDAHPNMICACTFTTCVRVRVHTGIYLLYRYLCAYVYVHV